jgi:hypothetical protein
MSHITSTRNLTTFYPETDRYGKLRSRKFTAQEQEQALFSSDGIYVPQGTEVIIIAGPRPRDWKKIRKVDEKFGDDTLILIVNGRTDIVKDKMKEEDITWVKDTFKPVFHYAPPPIVDSKSISNRDILLYHEFGKSWYLAEKYETKGAYPNLSQLQR